MKKKAFLSSIVTIALCLCLIAGSTFALFTDTTNFNIAVTSGDIEILATSEIARVYSAKKYVQGQDKDEFLIDEYGNYYYHEEQSASYEKDINDIITKGVFSNGGDVQFVDGKLTLSRITPGDRVDVTINVENNSDVAFVYRYKLTSNNTNLATGMVVTIDGTSYESLAVWTSDWKAPILAPDGTGGTIDPKTISIELPVYAGNEYQTEKAESKTESVEYTITVEAVQANAVTTNEEEFQIYQQTSISGVAPTLDQSGDDPGAQTVLFENLFLKDGATLAVDSQEADSYSIRNITVDVENFAIDVSVDGTIRIYDCDFMNVAAGEYILNCSANAQIRISDNCTINGERVTQETISQYINGTAQVTVFQRNGEA